MTEQSKFTFTNIKPDYNITFLHEGKEIGKLDFNGPAMIFTGNAEASAKVFIDYVAKMFSDRLAEERKAAQPDDEPLGYWNAVEGWVDLSEEEKPVAWVEPEFWSYLERSNCGTAYRLPDGKRQPLYTRPQQAAPAIPEWQPIETAPKTSKAILVYCTGRKNTFTASYGKVGGFLQADGWRHFGGGDMVETPTHWMPLPAAPQQGEQA